MIYLFSVHVKQKTLNKVFLLVSPYISSQFRSLTKLNFQLLVDHFTLSEFERKPQNIFLFLTF